MAKKLKKVAKTSSVSKPRNRVHIFRKEAKVEPVKETIKGAVYFALKSLKSGTTEQVLERALKNGLKDYTGQDPRVQTLVMIQRLRQEGIVATEKPESENKAKAAPTPAKKVVVKKAKKSGKPKLKVVASKPAPEADAATA